MSDEGVRWIEVLKDSLVLPLREYLYFLGVGSIVLINFVTGNALFFWKGVGIGSGLGYLLVSLITTPLMFAIMGNYVRSIYVGEKFSRWRSIKQGIYSSLLFFAYALLFSSISFFVNKLFNSSVFWVFLVFIFSFFMPSYILEILKVFYFEDEMFSISDVVERVFTWRYVVATLIVLLINALMVNILFTHFSSLIATSWFGLALNSVLQSILFAYINLFSITVYLKMFWEVNRRMEGVI